VTSFQTEKKIFVQISPEVDVKSVCKGVLSAGVTVYLRTATTTHASLDVHSIGARNGKQFLRPIGFQ